MALLLGILKRELSTDSQGDVSDSQLHSAIIFCNTKKHTEIIAKRLKLNGFPCEFIIGDLPQVKRLKVIDALKAGKIKTLVATDVAARGLDIDNLAMVINYDVPNEAENYVHRIGRTARAGKTGKAITLASEQDVYELPAIERYIGKKVPAEIAGQELYAEDKSAHMRVFTDTYDDRKQRDSSGSRKKHSGSFQTSSLQTGSFQTYGLGENKRKPDNRKRKTGTSQSTAGKLDKKSQLPHTDLSNLSMEERMAVYKKKYDKTGGGKNVSASGGRSETKSSRTAGSKTAGSKTAGSQTAGSQTAGSQTAGLKTPKKQKTKHPRTPDLLKQVKPEVKQDIKQQPQETPVKKKGFFEKLKGIFTKK
jgi:ATP-dependent RNA helicase RhlB